MAQVDFAPAPVFRSAAPKARMTIYFALLIISLIAMLVACLFMFLEIRRFGGFGTIRGKAAAVERATPIMLAEAAIGRSVV
ncbi:MAG: hypothetical protein WD669_13045 [Pirellulales bacterium]